MIRPLHVLDAAAFARERLGFDADPIQAQILEVGHTRGLLNCSRQWGKSTTMAVKAVHRAYVTPASQIMIVSHTQRQSNELMGKAEGFLRMLDLRVRGDGKNAHSLQFPNGSRIVALPGKARNIRAFSATMLLVDEAARVDDEVYDAVRPMLAATDGELWMMSTPDGRRGFFYDEWVNGTEPWLRIMAKATDCPRYSARFLEAERRRSEWKFRQEYLCEFVRHTGAMFDEAQVRGCLTDDSAVFDPKESMFW